MNNSCEELEKILIDYLIEDGKQIFKISKIVKSNKYKYSLLLVLKRINPNECILCLENHNFSNAYMTVNVNSKKVYFYCYYYDNYNYIFSDSDDNKVRLADLTYRELYEITKLYFPNLHENMEEPPPPKKVFIDMSDVYQKYFEEELDELLKQVTKNKKK